MNAEDISAMTDEEFSLLFPGCARCPMPTKFKIGEVVIEVSHFGGPQERVFKVTGHGPPSQIDPKGWTVYVDGVDIPGYKNGGWSCGWEGYFQSLEVFELERAYSAPSKKPSRERRTNILVRVLRWLLKCAE
jgi:hypothetical protein